MLRCFGPAHGGCVSPWQHRQPQSRSASLSLLSIQADVMILVSLHPIQRKTQECGDVNWSSILVGQALN